MERKQIPRYITDASVAVKWFIEETDTPQAVNLKALFEKGEVDLEAPSLITYEVASALRFHAKVQLAPKEFLSAIEVLTDLQITREPNDLEWSTTLQLSTQNPISVYDAVYLSFAIHRDAKMVTADSSLLRNLRAPETRESVMLLSSF